MASERDTGSTSLETGPAATAILEAAASDAEDLLAAWTQAEMEARDLYGWWAERQDAASYAAYRAAADRADAAQDELAGWASGRRTT